MKEIKSLTSIRGIAAILVVIFHYIAPINRDLACISCQVQLLDRAYLAVDFFFILSGFILYLVYEQSFAKHFSSKQDLRQPVLKYLWSRFARIYPLHLFTLLIMLAWIFTMSEIIEGYQLNPRNTLETFIYNLFLVHAWGLYHDVSWNYPSWSISAEMFAYLLFPLLMMLVLRNKFSRMILSALAALSILYVGNVTELKYDEYGALIRCVQSFSLGLSLTVFYSAVIKLKSKLLSIFQVLSVLSIGVLMELLVKDSYIVLMLAGLVLLLAPDRGLVCRALDTKALYLLGLYSYSIYMLHAPIMMIYKDLRSVIFQESLSSSLSFELLILVSLLAITILLAKYSYLNVELKVRNLLNSYFNARSKNIERISKHH